MHRWIYWTESGGLAVNPAATKALKELERPLVVTTVGFVRLGKSFLLNQLCGRECFPVSPGVSICTRGLNFTVRNQTVFVDTEGLAGMAGGPDHDAKIFLLAFLLSSVLVYCSKGVIDEPSLSQLSFVTQLTASLQCENKPALVWLLKDFALGLKSVTGEEITANEYLAKALEGDTPLRSVLRDTFPSRECVTLVRPCQEESDMYEIQSENLRPEYLSGVDTLRSTISRLKKPREVRGAAVTGQVRTTQMLCELTEQVVKVLNAQALPQLGTVWDSISESRCEEAKGEALKFLAIAVDKAQATLPVNEGELRQGLKTVKQETLKVFKAQALGDRMQAYERVLKTEIQAAFATFANRNYEVSQTVCTDILRKLYKEFIEMLDFHSAEELAQAWTEIKNEYDSKCKGPAKAAVWNVHATDHILQTMKLLAYKMDTKHRLDLFKVKSQLQHTTLELENCRKTEKPTEDREVSQKPPSCQECTTW